MGFGWRSRRNFTFVILFVITNKGKFAYIRLLNLALVGGILWHWNIEMLLGNRMFGHLTQVSDSLLFGVWRAYVFIEFTSMSDFWLQLLSNDADVI